MANALNISSAVPLSPLLGGNGLSTGGSPALYVVSKVSGQAGYTAIQSAINQAATDGHDVSNPVTVWVMDGTYVEDLTLLPGINLAAANPGANAVFVQGTATYVTATATQFLSITNINFTDAGSNPAFWIQTAAGTCTYTLTNCGFYSNTQIAFRCTSPNATINMTNCNFRGLTTKQSLDLQDFASIVMQSCTDLNVDTPSEIGGSGTASGTMSIYNSILTDTLNLNDTVSVTMYNGSITEVLNQPFDLVDAGTLLTLNGPVVNANTNYVVAGIGQVTLNSATLVGTVIDIQNTVTVAKVPTAFGLISTKGPATFATSGFAINSPFQNTTNQDLILFVTYAVTAAAGGALSIAVASTSAGLAAADQGVLAAYSTATPDVITLPIYVPSGYYCQVTSANITAGVSSFWMGA